MLRKAVVVLLIAAGFSAAYYLGRRKRAQRLDAFARCLAARQAKMYGAYWCPHCADQKELFGSSFRYILYVECGVAGSRAEAAPCLAAGVKRFPTWQFADGSRHEGTLGLDQLGRKTGCALK